VYLRTLQTFSAQLLSSFTQFYSGRIREEKAFKPKLYNENTLSLEGRGILDLRWGCSKPTSSSASERWEL